MYVYSFVCYVLLFFQMYRNHSTTENMINEDSLVLYEATGYTRWEEACGIKEDDIRLVEDMSTESDSSSSVLSSRECSSGPSEDDSNASDKQLLIPDKECEFENDTSSDIENATNSATENEDNNMSGQRMRNCDDESEDEITHKPISAKEVIEHNKLFGYKTADYWWVHNDKVYSDYFTAYLRPMTHQEIMESTKEEIKELKKELANDTSVSQTLEEFEKLLSRFEVKLNRQPSIPSGDPNLLPFPTPHDFIPADMRKWICNWKPFDFELEPWPSSEPISLTHPNDISDSTLRLWLDDWEPFSMEIDGECAWKCLELDVIKNDIITQQQAKILECRHKRTDMEDQARMARRRNKLKDYFTKKYHISDCDLEKYSNFVPNLEENALQLLSLC